MSTLFYLFATNLVILIVGYGVFPLLPGYAMRFGASPGSVGIFMGLVYVAISTGSMLPSLLPAHISRKRTFLAGSLVGLPALFLLGHATALWQVGLLTMAIWFSGGVGLALSSVYTGLYSADGRQGRAFALVSLSTPAATLTGGLLVGRLVEWQGYAFAFTVLGLLWLALPLIVIFKLGEIQVGGTGEKGKQANGSALAGNTAFTALMVAALLVAGSISLGRMGRSLSMELLAFSPAAISGTTAVAGLALIPFMLLSSALADRLGAQRFLIGGYLLAGAGTLVLMMAGQLWHFSLAMTLLLVGRAAGDALAPAVASHLLSKEELPRALPRLKATNWMAGSLSFFGGGYAIQYLGFSMVMTLATAVTLVAVGLLVLSLTRRPATTVAPTPVPAVALQPVPCGD